MIYSLRNVLPVCAAVLVFHAVAAAAAPNVVASVRPLHGLVAAVMDGVGTPTLLLDGAESPHSYALTPSDANALAEADVVVWVGEPLETFLERPLAALSSSATVLTLAEHPAIMTHASVPLEVRQELGIDDGLIRLSCGIEATEDLIEDLKNGFRAIES